jgi:hypothetical protein
VVFYRPLIFLYFVSVTTWNNVLQFNFVPNIVLSNPIFGRFLTSSLLVTEINFIKTCYNFRCISCLT